MNQETWKRMMFKGRKVHAQVDETGHLVTHKGMAVIKYQLDQEMTYLARASAVLEIDPALLIKKKNVKRKRNGLSRERSLAEGTKAAHQEGAITVYTDGACCGNPGPAGIGILLRYGRHRKEISRFIGSGTNNIAELTAIKMALEEIKDPHLPVILYTDSAYAHGVLTSLWKARKNQELVQEIRQGMARFPHLTIRKVEGHAGVEGNETANRLASEAIRGK